MIRFLFEAPWSMVHAPFAWTKGLGVLALLTLVPACSDPVETLLTQWTATLSPVPPHFLEGEAAAVSQFGRTQVSVLVRGGLPGEEYLWRVEEGTCQGSGALRGGAAQYPPLRLRDDGTATAATALAGVFREGDRNAVKVVGTAGSQAGKVLACGEFRLLR